MRNIGMFLILLVSSTSAAAGSYYTCTNPETGKKSFSRTPCGENAERRKEGPVNSADYSGNSQRAAEIRSEDAHNNSVVEQRRNEVIEKRQARERQEQLAAEEKACIDKIMRSLPSGHRPSVNLIRQCKGLPPKQSSPRGSSIPATPPPPSVITNCDAGGCWDNHGKRYNSGGGPTHIRQDGKVCQRVGAMMQCN